jgi:phosphatidylglycerophosphatase A
MGEHDRRKEALRSWYGAAATLCGLGCLGGLAGTAGTLVSCLALFAFGEIGIAALGVTAVVGAIASDRYMKRSGADGVPREIVIDKVVGYWASMLRLDLSYAVVAFFLFRIVDIVKPFPVSIALRLPGGAGVMAGGILCGAMANALMRVISWMFFSGGFDLIYGALGLGK